MVYDLYLYVATGKMDFLKTEIFTRIIHHFIFSSSLKVFTCLLIKLIYWHIHQHTSPPTHSPTKKHTLTNTHAHEHTYIHILSLTFITTGFSYTCMPVLLWPNFWYSESNTVIVPYWSKIIHEYDIKKKLYEILE